MVYKVERRQLQGAIKWWRVATLLDGFKVQGGSRCSKELEVSSIVSNLGALAVV